MDKFLLRGEKGYYGAKELARTARVNLAYYQRYVAEHGTDAKLLRGGSLMLVTDMIAECVADILGV